MFTGSRTSRKTALWALAAVLSASSAWAQDETPADPPAQEEAAGWVHKDTFEFGYADWALRGNEGKFLQYGTPAAGFHFRLLDMTFPFTPVNPFARLFLGHPFEPDSGAYGLVQLSPLRTWVDVDLRRSSYFADPTPVPVDESRDLLTMVTAEHRFNNDLGLWLRYRRDQKDRAFPGPQSPIKTRVRTTTAGLEGRVFDGDASLLYQDMRFVDRTGFQPESTVKTVSFSYGRQFGESLGLEGRLGQTFVEQTGLQDSKIRSAGVRGDLALGSDTDLSLDLSRDTIDLPNVQNAHVRERFTTQANLSTRWNGVSAKFGYRHREVERFRADQSFVDVLKYDKLEARLSGKISSDWRLSGRWYWEHGGDNAVFQTPDTRQLLWDDRVMGQAKLEGSLAGALGYATYTVNYKKNEGRDVEVTTGTFALGLSKEFSPTTSGYLELTNEQTKAEGVVEGTLDLDQFFPSATSVTAGFDWALRGDTWLSASYSHYFTNNENPFSEREGNVRQRFLTASVRHKFATGNEVSLTVAPWHFEDRLYPNGGFDTTAVFLNFHVKF